MTRWRHYLEVCSRTKLIASVYPELLLLVCDLGVMSLHCADHENPEVCEIWTLGYARLTLGCKIQYLTSYEVMLIVQNQFKQVQ